MSSSYDDFLRAWFEQAPIGAFYYDHGLRVRDCNDALVRLLGATDRAGLLGLDLRRVDDKVLVPLLERALTGEVVRWEGPYRSTSGGKSVHASVQVMPLRDDTGAIVGGFGFAEDISERLAMQAKLAQTDRMAQMGLLAAGVAHEINNPLAYLLTNLDLVERRRLPELARRAPDPALAKDLTTVVEMVGVAREGAERIRDIVRDLRTFSRDDGSQGAVDVHAILDACVNVAWSELRQRARLVRAYGARAQATGSEARLGQVFLNLLLNAVQALPRERVEANQVTLRTEDGEHGVVVEVTDNGPGVAPDVAPHVFEPFFTTKPAGVGTGLGLWICKGLVTGFGGALTLESPPGGGATFRVVLPRAPDDAQPAEAPSRTAAARGRVLLVDDEPALAQAVQAALEDELDVEIALTGEEALRALRSGGPFAAVVCDLMLPDMTGMRLFAELSSTLPELAPHVVFVTGAAFAPAARAFLRSVANDRLEKPFRIDDLRGLLNRHLEAGAAP